MKKRALISVYDKAGVAALASFLAASGWEIISTGGTAQYLAENGVAVTDVAAVTGFPECLDGRVKTLHPAIHAGLLARRDSASHMETLEKLGLETIGLVCVNLYPFFEKVNAGLSLPETVEFIDIGGPAMLRSASKNFRDVIVLTDPADYGAVIEGLRADDVPLPLKKRLAGKVFNLTSAYDAAIARYLLDEEYPAYYPVSVKKVQTLRYGENSHQSAALYVNTGASGVFGAMEQLAGKELSYNNIRDLDLAWKAVCAFGLKTGGTAPQGEAEVRALGLADTALPAACVAVKHNTPCGVAEGNSLLEAYRKAYASDPVSIFGGIVACNTTVDAATAGELAGLFLEIVAAPGYEPEALSILTRKKNLRVMVSQKAPGERHEYIAVDGGVLVQETNRRLLEKWDVVTRIAPRAEDIADMIFGIRAVGYVKSNAIVVIKNRATVGIGGGETNRIWAAELALSRAAKNIAQAAENGAGDGSPAPVLASDAFFPFPDVVEAAHAAGIKTIVQVGGSQNDTASVETADRLGIAMVLTGTRHFKH
ncbi:MAG: bifunctional phosphoribosylaminoimidazolecarboxamide formyltransferase/IMP cyclohydrolase [Spirochaetaceae bacterium]|nr:bifunctional phosphoribosylaminoimidazolecarboxamide formyltransferase/IMP cyclohydrolase [Spirochaetaceae bacterium]